MISTSSKDSSWKNGPNSLDFKGKNSKLLDFDDKFKYIANNT
jgi:hypothetical protein